MFVIETLAVVAVVMMYLAMVRYSTRQAKRQYVQGILKDVEDDYNQVNVEAFLDAKGEDEEVVIFTVHRGANRSVSWRMRPQNNEYLPGTFVVHGGMLNRRELWLEYEIKDRLKNIGNEAYVYWKMANR